MPSTASRRQFLTWLSAGVASAPAYLHGVSFPTPGSPWLQLHASVLKSPHAPSMWMPESISIPALHVLAEAAVDAARSAGANYADVRVAFIQCVSIGVFGSTVATPGGMTIAPRFMYGIRVRVGCGWAFTHGSVPATDAITTVARNAVATARGFDTINSSQQKDVVAWDEVRSTPSMIGSWESPYVMDPFTVPIADQCALLSAYVHAANRVHNGGSGAISAFTWERETRVFVSSRDDALTQTIRRSIPTIGVAASLSIPQLPHATMPVLAASAGGYEQVAILGLQDRITQRTEELKQILRLPQRALEVGRYSLVMDGASMGRVFMDTLGLALESDRALGYELGASGLGYLNPVERYCGTTVASPVLTVSGVRTEPSVTAARWDDDGVETREFSLLREGRLINYATSRQTAAAIQSRFSKSLQGTTSTGCAVAGESDAPVMVRVPHVRGVPNTTNTSMDDLCRNVTHGLLVRQVGWTSVDSTLSSGIIGYWAPMLEIRNGRIVSFLRGNGIQLQSRRLWNALDLMGDTSTVQDVAFTKVKGQPSEPAWYAASMPAGHFKEVDVVSIAASIHRRA